MQLRSAIAFTILTHAAFNGSRVAVSLFALKLSASPLTVGILMSLYAALPMLLSVHAGRLMDRIGTRKPVVFSTLCLIIGVTLPWLWPQLSTLFFASCLIGTAFMLLHVAINNVVGALGDAAQRTANFSWLALGFSVSGFLGPMLAGFGIDTLGYANTFGLLAILPTVALVALWSKIRRLSQHKQRTSMTTNNPPLRVMDLLSNPRLRAVFIASGLLSMGWDLYTFLIPIHGSHIGLSASTIGFIMGMFAAATFAVRLLLPLFSGRLREWQLIAIALLVSAMIYALFPFSYSVSTLIVLSCVLGFGLGCAQPMVMSLLYAVTPAGRQGEAIGIRTTVLSTSSTFLPLASGALGAALGVTPVFWLLAGLLLLGGWAAARKGWRQRTTPQR